TKIVVVTNLARAIEKLKQLGVWMIGLAGEADDSLYSMKLVDSVAIVAGAEVSGMRQRTKAIVNQRVFCKTHKRYHNKIFK
ncbi:TrmH family RNA methyltransferase, partial [Francisella tularensis]|uniref:TrmH family RNA methyltransferase n=1 Tax=Francisella tularensis TaxID=263 RepID=UPI0023ABFC6F|nr:hypothetical protein [Francisella tularensis subsp. holarctica]